jgi:hypothetical protein
MGLNEVPTTPDKKSAAEKLKDAVIKHEASLIMLESVASHPGAKPAAKPAATDTALGLTPAQATTSDARTGASRPNPSDSSTLARRNSSDLGVTPADATNPALTPFRKSAIAMSQQLETRVANNIKAAQNGTFGIKSVLDNFDRIAQDSQQLNFQNLSADFKSLNPNDPNQRPAWEAESKLLHATGIIEMSKAQVAYDAAIQAKPNSDPNAATLIKIARDAVSVGNQDAVVQKGYAQKIGQYEAIVKQYKLDQGTVAPAAADSTATPAPRPGEQTTTRPATDSQQPAISTEAPTTAQDLAKSDAQVNQDTAARKQAEAQLFGDSTTAANAPKYLRMQGDIWNMVSELNKQQPAQAQDFNQKFFASNMSVADKQRYIDQVAANDKVLHDSASDLLKVAGDKVPAAANWYDANLSSFNALASYYKAAGEANDKGDIKGAQALWHKANTAYPLESQFLTSVLSEPNALRLDAKFTGDYQSLYSAGADLMAKGDVRNAESFFKDSIYAADTRYAQNVGDASQKVKDIAAKLTNGSALSPQDRLTLASEGFSNVDALTAPVQARINAATALSGLDQAHDGQAAGQYQASIAGQAYQAEIAGWYKDASDKAKNIDTKSIQTIGNALSSAANSDINLNKPENAAQKYGVLNNAAYLTGGKLWQQDQSGKFTQPGGNIAGLVDLPFTAPKMQAAFLITQQKGSDAVAAIKEAGSREAAAKGWAMHDVANNDKQLAVLMQQAHSMDPQHALDVMTRSDSLWKTPVQAVGGLLVFAAASYATKKLVNPALIEDMAPALAERGLVGTVAKTALRYAPTIAGVTAASATSIGVDRMGATHEGVVTAVGKGLSLVALVKGGQYMSRVGMVGAAPETAEGMFGAKSGSALTKESVLGRVVQEIGGKPLAQADMTSGQLVQKLSAGTARAESGSMIRALEGLPENTPVFKKGVLNPLVDKALLNTQQRELAGFARQGLEAAGAKSTGRVIPTISELNAARKGAAIDIQNGDINQLNRELAARSAVSNRFAGLARNATDKNVANAITTQVAGEGGASTKQQWLDLAAGKGVSAKELGNINNIIGEDAQIMKGGRWQGAFKDLPDEMKTRLKDVATKVTPEGGKPNLTTAQLVNFANENKIPMSQFDGILKDPVLYKNGAYNPDLLVRNPKTGAVTRAIEDPNFSITGRDKMQLSHLYSRLAKPGPSENSMLVAMARDSKQRVALSTDGSITKQAVVDKLLSGAKTPEELAAAQKEIATKYPKLAELKDDDVIVAGKKFQKSVVTRDIPQTMTKGDFVAWYKQAHGVDLNDPAQLKGTPWAKTSFSKTADDATIIKDGKWQFKVPKAARKTVGEADVSLRLKDVGLTEKGGNFLLTARQANLTAGELAQAMKEAKIDPAKVEALAKIPPETQLVKNGKVLSPLAVDRELSPTSKVYQGLVRSNQLNLTDSQRAVLAGEATDKQVADAWYRVDGKIGWRHPIQTAKQGGTAVVNGWTDFGRNLVNSKGGLTGFQGALDPNAGTFRATGAGFGVQNWASGVGGSLGAYTLYNGLSSLGGGWDDQLAEPTTPLQEFERRMGDGKGWQANAYSYLWMPQMPNLYSELGGNATWNATKQIFFTTSGEPIGQVIQGTASALSGNISRNYDLMKQLPDLKAIDSKPLVDNPSLLDQQPVNPQGLGPADTTNGATTPDTTSPAPTDTTTPAATDTTGLAPSSANPDDTRTPVNVPVKPAAAKPAPVADPNGDYLDRGLSGGPLGG